ncbi:hypothetical protein PYW08_016888 [Mythimna loreyi]|nr:hypothetical protein PYW08_016888 [Mythimna loreyi]
MLDQAEIPIATSDESQTMSENVFRRIQAAIVKGEIAPGSKISEPELARTYGISRGPLREAIHRLEGQRLLVRVPHVGARVVSLSHAELIELYEIRESLEGMACRLAAERMTDAEIEELRQVLHTHERDAAFQAGVGYYQQEGDFDFHYRIIQGAGNRTLTQMLCGELYQLVRMYRIQFSATPNRPRQAFAEHHRILDAIADRDGELAELLMRRHIGASKRNIARHFPDGAPSSRVVGAINANHALLAKRAGFKAIYLSGGGVAAGSLGVPDLGITGLDDVLTDVRRITDVCDLPLLVDVDTGFGSSAFNVARTVKSMIKFGAAAIHIEDQVGAKRCGHRPNKEIVSQQEMVDRIKAAVDARTDDSFVIMARTDALAVEGLESALERAAACIEAGADMVFPEAITELEMYKLFASRVKAPILANITEFGATPLYTTEQLKSADVSIVLYPLSAFRAMNKAAENVYTAIRRDGTQQNVIDTMQTRMELYDRIDYHTFEQKLDALFAAKK